jgi:hypothetical protein
MWGKNTTISSKVRVKKEKKFAIIFFENEKRKKEKERRGQMKGEDK